jgi:hypothetical protein
MVSNKRQHWVPSSYLAAWSDPNKPPNHHPFVHIFGRDGGSHARRAPENIFHMSDLYTVFEGTRRDLRIEKAFAQWERTAPETRQSLRAPEEQITLMVLDPCSAAFVGVE